MAGARQAVQQFVGETFFGLLLKELRKSTSKEHLFYGGRGEATLQPQLDQVMAERLATSRGFALSEAMFDFIYRDTPHSPVRSAASVSAELKET